MKTLSRHPLLAALVGACALAAPLAAQDRPAEPAPAARAEAEAPKVAKVDEPAPAFTLKDTAGNEHALKDLIGEDHIVVLEWFNPDCPFVRAYHEKTRQMNELAAAYKDRKVTWIAINSGAAGMQGPGAERNARAIKDFEIAYPVLIDESGAVGRAYGAKTTPHMFVIDAKGVLRYAGGIDDSAGRGGAKHNYVKDALDALLAGKPVEVKQSKSFGCSVKYSG